MGQAVEERLEGETDGGLGFHLRRAEQAIMARKAGAIRHLDLTVPQCKVLGFLRDGAAKSSTQLSREALVTSQTMNGIVKNLELKGLVERRTSPDHARVVLVSLTVAGIERARRATEFSDTIDRGLREAMPETDYALLLKLLDTVTEIAPTTAGEMAPA
ncbi:MarR family winged helix-turn-helix transcriptional regulator [Streptomyces sp. NPDC088725]|uniref:MarR family winged helix-turn-helix transcriptional regulator n=1 Tax=Streptomyces sp. NPDC088725 TaxID=3365873 RepID=UPI00381FDCFF